MMELSATTSHWCQSGWLVAVIAPAAAVLGHLLARGVGLLVADRERMGRRGFVELATAVVAVALWWWEVRWLGQLPAGAVGPDLAPVCLRYLAHLFLFAFLAAAAWVDLLDRVIPDSITVPGVLCGLAWNAIFPATLPPVGHAVARSFAPPTIATDALAAFGPLQHAGLPGWLGGPAGLAAIAALFVGWCRFGLPPAAPPTHPAGHDPDGHIAALRLPIAVVGLAGIAAAWFVGRDHWTGVVTALTGLAVAGGMIWATRAGASRALGREAMGFGDVTLMAMAGAWLGWQPCLLACVFGVFIGLAHGLSQLVRHSESEIPFGPSLCLGIVSVVIGWRPIWSATEPSFEQPLQLAVAVALVIALTAATLWGWARLRGGRD